MIYIKTANILRQVWKTTDGSDFLSSLLQTSHLGAIPASKRFRRVVLQRVRSEERKPCWREASELALAVVGTVGQSSWQQASQNNGPPVISKTRTGSEPMFSDFIALLVLRYVPKKIWDLQTRMGSHITTWLFALSEGEKRPQTRRCGLSNPPASCLPGIDNVSVDHLSRTKTIRNTRLRRWHIEYVSSASD
jgi:hypothetical protein